MRRTAAPAALLASVLLAGCLGLGPPEILLATTTSTQDSGLLDVLEPAFEQDTGRELGVVAVGTGQALEMGRRGDADVLLVHSPRAERAFMDEGYGLERTFVFANEFVVLGPPGDPAGVPEGNATRALERIHANGSTFVSRGDDSGTHLREQRLWQQADLDPSAFGSWYRQTGQGMGPTLIVASEQQAYTLSDDATYLNVSANLGDRWELDVLVDDDPTLENPYHVISVDEQGRVFADWLTGDHARDLVAEFELQGEQVFDTPEAAS